MGLIELHQVSYRFPEGGIGLEKTDLSIEEGEKVILLGSNGSGKSTLLRILGGLYPPTTGTYLFNGTPVGRRVPPNFRQQVGLLF
ncbi:MAG: ATP-binding cassette domain-containing protein, partial [Campylobacterales bacterium]